MISTEVPAASSSAHPQLETRQAKASPASQTRSYLTCQQCSPWLSWEQGWLQEGQGLMLCPLPAVSMFLEESSLGRQHWRQNLALLLQRLATTLRWVLQSQPAPGSTWGYLVIKVRARLGSGARISTCRNWPSDVQRDVMHGAALNGCSWGIPAFSEVRNTDHLCGTSCSSRPASRSSRHCQRMWPRWCGARQERVRPCRASWDCCWRWFGGRCVQPWEGMELPVPRSRAALSFPGAFPIPLPKASLQTSLPNVWHV